MDLPERIARLERADTGAATRDLAVIRMQIARAEDKLIRTTLGACTPTRSNPVLLTLDGEE